MTNMNLSAINVQIDSYDKEVANGILKNLGLNMTTYVNMAIKQLIYKDGLPFEVSNPKPSNALLTALKEADEIEKDIKNGTDKGYDNVDEMLRAILND